MEEIKLSREQMTLLTMQNEELRSLMNKSGEGVLIGMPWNEKVYDYLFESGLSQNEVNEIMCLSGAYILGADLIDEEDV